MRNSATALLAATGLLIAGCSQKTENASTNTTVNTADETATPAENAAMAEPAAESPSAAQGFANKAAQSDAFEIASSKLAADNASSAAVKKFATQMIDAHTQSTAKLTKVAGGLNPPVTPDATLDAAHQAKIDALKAKTGKEFDEAYAADQVAAHDEALTMLKGYSASGEVPELKAFATELTPKVAAHLNMAKALKP
jgi:putative membrane protein